MKDLPFILVFLLLFIFCYYYEYYFVLVSSSISILLCIDMYISIPIYMIRLISYYGSFCCKLTLRLLYRL